MDEPVESGLIDEPRPPRRRTGGRHWLPVLVAAGIALVPAVAVAIHHATQAADPYAAAGVDVVATGPASPGAVFGWFAYGDPNAPVAPGQTRPGTPVDAVERAGLHLPDDASVEQVETQWVTGMAESYLFVFRVDAATAAAFCTQDGLGGARPASRIPASVADSLGSPTVTPGSRWCGGPSPADSSWSRYVAIEAGDPATVRLSLQRS